MPGPVPFWRRSVIHLGNGERLEVLFDGFVCVGEFVEWDVVGVVGFDFFGVVGVERSFVEVDGPGGFAQQYARVREPLFEGSGDDVVDDRDERTEDSADELLPLVGELGTAERNSGEVII